MRSIRRLPSELASTLVARLVAGTRGTLVAVLTWTDTAVRAVAFWTAVTLPAATLAYVAAGPARSVPTVGACLAANVLAPVVGHSHDGVAGDGFTRD
jgi:hypothetical protein